MPGEPELHISRLFRLEFVGITKGVMPCAKLFYIHTKASVPVLELWSNDRLLVNLLRD